MREQHTKRHMVADIHGAIAAAQHKDKFVLALLGHKTFDECIADLRMMIQDGYEVVPSEDCDNQDYSGRCKGHEVWKEPESGSTAKQATEGLERMGHALSGREYMQ